MSGKLARYEVDAVVIGAGVVGLAVARELAAQGREVLILERWPRFGEGVSSRNSEVIHAGIYYPPGSLKAELCLRGRDALYDYCASRGIPHARTGKLIVAVDRAETTELELLLERGRANGVSSLVEIDGLDAMRMEPELYCAAALWSPDTGIVDSHALMLALLADAEASGAILCRSTPVVRLHRQSAQVVVECGGEMPALLRPRILVNAAGLSAPDLALPVWLDAPRSPVRFARGNYFTLTGHASPFMRLVYPMPEPGGLGVHFTRDLAGRAKFGPDVEWSDTEAYEVNAGRGAAFYDRIRRYWPGLPDGALQPDYVGIRPKLDGVGSDFVIAGPDRHGLPGVVHLLGIESPGLTASLAIAQTTVTLLS